MKKNRRFFRKKLNEMEFSKIFKLDYFHQFLSYLTDWKCKKHLNSSNFSNLKSAARAKTFARQKIIMKKKWQNWFCIFYGLFAENNEFMHVHASARTPDKRAEKFDKCRCVLHFEPLKYLKNAWN